MGWIKIISESKLSCYFKRSKVKGIRNDNGGSKIHLFSSSESIVHSNTDTDIEEELWIVSWAAESLKIQGSKQNCQRRFIIGACGM